MVVEEQQLARLYESARRALGDEEAATLMNQLRRWQELATRADLAALRSDLRSDIVEMRSELRGEIAELRTEARAGLGGLRGEIGGLRGEIGGLRGEMGELRGELYRELNRQTVRVVFAMVPIVLSSVGLAAAVT